MTDSNGYLAKPSGDCCLKGSLHDGEPRGRYEEVSGVNTYISAPSAAKDNGNIVLYFPDVFGFVSSASCSNKSVPASCDRRFGMQQISDSTLRMI